MKLVLRIKWSVLHLGDFLSFQWVVDLTKKKYTRKNAKQLLQRRQSGLGVSPEEASLNFCLLSWFRSVYPVKSFCKTLNFSLRNLQILPSWVFLDVKDLVSVFWFLL